MCVISLMKFKACSRKVYSQAEGLSDKHKLLFAQRKAEFLQDFGEDVSALEAAEKEVRLKYNF